MSKEIARDLDEMEQEAPMRHAGAHVTKILRKCVYSLPSGRKMTVILDDEGELTPAMAYSQQEERSGEQGVIEVVKETNW